jgi:hypothetical protein
VECDKWVKNETVNLSSGDEDEHEDENEDDDEDEDEVKRRWSKKSVWYGGIMNIGV